MSLKITDGHQKSRNSIGYMSRPVFDFYIVICDNSISVLHCLGHITTHLLCMRLTLTLRSSLVSHDS